MTPAAAALPHVAEGLSQEVLLERRRIAGREAPASLFGPMRSLIDVEVRAPCLPRRNRQVELLEGEGAVEERFRQPRRFGERRLDRFERRRRVFRFVTLPCPGEQRGAEVAAQLRGIGLDGGRSQQRSDGGVRLAGQQLGRTVGGQREARTRTTRLLAC